MGFALALLALVLYSANLLVTKVASGSMDLDVGVTVAAFSNVVVGVGFFGLQVASGHSPLAIEAWAVALFLVSGVFSTYLGRWFFFATVARLGAARASAFQITNPLFTVVIAWIFLGERLRLLDLGAVAVTLTGLYLVSYVAEPAAESSRGSGWRQALAAGRRTVLHSGAVVALLSASSYAVANVLRGAAVRRWNEPILGGVLGAAVGMAAQVLATAKGRDLWGEVARAPRRALTLYGLIGLITISAQVSMIAAMSTIPVGVTNLITMSTPILVTPASYFLLKNQEGLRPRTVLGMAIVLIGVGTLILR
ncbi:MAG: DMT family transporter [Deltaproteobacteria bacterium]|nr:DMT family transporter [Deltaproteobacteria bacterium]